MTKVITIRNLPLDVEAKLTDMARRKGLSREEFLRRQLQQIAIGDEVRRTEEKYENLVHLILERLEENNRFMEDVVNTMERLLGEE